MSWYALQFVISLALIIGVIDLVRDVIKLVLSFAGVPDDLMDFDTQI